MRDDPEVEEKSESQFSRAIVSLIAVAGGVFIAAEPLMFDAPAGLQLFQGLMALGLWTLVMFGGASDPDKRE